jgi:hypothetical protein
MLAQHGYVTPQLAQAITGWCVSDFVQTLETLATMTTG